MHNLFGLYVHNFTRVMIIEAKKEKYGMSVVPLSLITFGTLDMRKRKRRQLYVVVVAAAHKLISCLCDTISERTNEQARLRVITSAEIKHERVACY